MWGPVQWQQPSQRVWPEQPCHKSCSLQVMLTPASKGRQAHLYSPASSLTTSLAMSSWWRVKACACKVAGAHGVGRMWFAVWWGSAKVMVCPLQTEMCRQGTRWQLQHVLQPHRIRVRRSLCEPPGQPAAGSPLLQWARGPHQQAWPAQQLLGARVARLQMWTVD